MPGIRPSRAVGSASIKKSARIRVSGQPSAFSSPISAARCCRPYTKSSPRRINDDAIRKKLSPRNRPPKFMALSTLTSACARTGLNTSPSASVCTAARSRVCSVAASPASGGKRNPVTEPKRVPHNSRPLSNVVISFGVWPYSFQYPSLSGSLRRPSSSGMPMSQSRQVSTSLRPGKSGARSRSIAISSMDSTRWTVKVRVFSTKTFDGSRCQ